MCLVFPTTQINKATLDFTPLAMAKADFSKAARSGIAETQKARRGTRRRHAKHLNQNETEVYNTISNQYGFEIDMCSLCVVYVKFDQN